MTYSKSSTVTLTATKATEFSLTGIADINNIEFNGKAYSGAKIYATLPQGIFPYDQEFDLHAVNVEYQGSGNFKGLEKVFVLQEGSYDRLVFAFDSSEMISGSKIIVKGDSIFYIDGKMYQLTEDYEITYTRDSSGNEDYDIFLGYIYNSDVKAIYNYDEERSNGHAYVIRVEFYEDVFVNDNFEFVHDSLPQGYEYPVYIYCPQDDVNKQITGGQYYWNDGQHQILELYGYGNHNQDMLFGAPGTKLVQNGGYYIFKDEMHAYYNSSAWVVGEEVGTFNSSSFNIIGEHASDTTELRLTTNDRWFTDVYQVTVENMSETEPYAIYHTSANGVVTPMTEFVYHGQSTANGYNSIFGFRNFEGTEAGEMITIIKGTRIWRINQYWTATEDINIYYNGSYWVVGSDGSASNTLTLANFTDSKANFYEANRHNVRMYMTSQYFNNTNGDLVVETGAIRLNGTAYTTLYYHGNNNNILEIRGDNTRAFGVEKYKDTIVIEEGTKLWQRATGLCVEFTEEISLVYVGQDLKDPSGNIYNYQWVTTKNNVNVSVDNISRAFNEGTEPRIGITAGIVQNNLYTYVSVDPSKGVPIVNGVEKTDQIFSYSNEHNLIGFRGGDYGSYIGAYIYIPAGSVWWTTQGSMTFVEDIYCVYNASGWSIGYRADTHLDDIALSDVYRIYNEGSNEIRLRVSPDVTGYTYYGPTAINGEAYLTKANGTTINVVAGYWYGGNTTYKDTASLFGLQASGIGNLAEGDLLTIKAGTKVIYTKTNGMTGYNVISEDIVYVYSNGSFSSATGYNVTFSFNNATVSVDGTAIRNGDTLALIQGTHQLSITAASGYAVTGLSNASGDLRYTNNLDGTYTVTVTQHGTISINTKQSMKLNASSISHIAVYDETNASPDCMGVRFNMNPSAFSNVNAIVYGLTWNGRIDSSINGGVYHSSVFNTPHNYFELRFDTRNLKVGDTFTIKAGTVFNANGLNYAIEWTEDILGMWNGTAWLCNPVQLGTIEWNNETVSRIINYSDVVNGETLNYGIRIYMNVVLFNDANGPITSFATINGATHGGGFYHHGSSNKILQVVDFNYTSGNNTLFIPAGTMICFGSSYYVTVNDLNATCASGENHAQWTF